MNKPKTIIFGKFPTLSTIYLTPDIFNNRKWISDKRYIEMTMRRFIDLNSCHFNFLNIKAEIISTQKAPCIKLTTAQYVGCIPIFSPKGKIECDLVVTGRFGENALEIISLLQEEIRPEYSDQYHLFSNSQLIPPIFFECCQFLDTYIEARKIKWNKFINKIKVEKLPSSSTLWTDYAKRTAINPLEFSIYKNKKNILTTDHDEWAELNYILKISIEILESFKVPQKIKFIYSDKINFLKNKLRDQRILSTNKLGIRMSDPSLIKKLKSLANIILSNKSNENLAWRLDYSAFFERFTQYLFKEISIIKGLRHINNPHYRIQDSNNISWVINYLEPDLILQKDNNQFVVDAKYKSHLFNKYQLNQDLKDVFRQDLHQILAYTSFNSMKHKIAILVYPFTDYKQYKLDIINPITEVKVAVYLVGIPIEKAKIEDTKQKLGHLITSCL